MKELWVEKYRPKTIDGYVWRDEAQRRQVLTWIKDKSVPHLLLSGPPGIGKTTMAKMLVNEIGIEDADVLEVNASRETGIDFIRDKIVPIIAILSPILSYIISVNSLKWFGFEFGFFILILNGFLTFLGLVLIRTQQN